MKTRNKLILTGSIAAIMLLAAIPTSISLSKAGNGPKTLSNEIKATKPGRGETVRFLPESLTKLWNMSDLVNTYSSKMNEIGGLMEYSDELASWAARSNPTDADKAYCLNLFEKYDIFRPTNNVLSWDDNLDAKSYRVIVSQDSKFSNIEGDYTVSGDENSVVFENPYTGTDYYWQVIATLNNDSLVYSDIFNFSVEDLPRTIYVEGVSNTRDLGGYAGLNGKKTKQGLVYRGMKLELASSKGIDTVKDQLGIKTDLDLRGIGEGLENPLSLPNYYHYPSPYDYTSGAVSTAGIEYLGTGSLVSNFGNAIKVFANKDNYPIYFHCSVGRDRTGWMGLALNLLCGVSEEVALKEFILSNFSTSGAYLKGSPVFFERVIRIYNYIKTFAGSNMSEKMETYLTTMAGVTHEQCENIRKIMLGEIDTGFVPGKVNEENYSDYAKVTFRMPGGNKVVQLVEKNELVTPPSTLGGGTWYHGDTIWDFSNDLVTEDMYLDYIVNDNVRINVHYTGLNVPDEVISASYNQIIDFSRFNRDGYTFKVYDDSLNLITNLTAIENIVINVIYKPIAGYVPSEKARIIVIAGQSNAAGIGHWGYLKESAPANKIAEFEKGFDNVMITGYSHLKYMDDIIPLKVDNKYASAGAPGTFGFELGLADRLSKVYEDETIYIVKYAHGGTNMGYDWISPSIGEPTVPYGGYEGQEPGWLYDGLVSSLNRTINWIKTNTPNTPVVEAFMWMQGEADAGDLSTVNIYGELFDKMIGDFKSEFSESLSSKFAVYDAGIADSEFWKYSQAINDIKLSRSDENNVYLDTNGRGLTTLYEPVGAVDGAHYDAACYVDLGHYFADEYIKHMDTSYKPDLLDITTDNRVLASLLDGEVTLSLESTFNGVSCTPKYSFYSLDDKIFKVSSDGVITPKAVGTTHLRVTAYYNDEVCNRVFDVRVVDTHLSEVKLTSFKDDMKLHLSGRNIVEHDKVTFINTLSGFETTFVGDKLIAVMKTASLDGIMSSSYNKVRVYVDDDQEGKIINVTTAKKEYVLASFDSVGTHTVRIQKASYEFRGYIELTDLYGPESFVEKLDTRRKVLFYGDSITAGCGICGLGSDDTIANEDGSITFAAKLVNANHLNAQVVAITGISLGARVFREKTMAQIYNRYSYNYSTPYNMNEFVPEMIIANLGTNDVGALMTQPNQYGDYCTQDDIVDGAMTMLKGLRSYYGSSSHIVFCYGMMGQDTRAPEAIRAALIRYSNEVTGIYDDKQIFMSFAFSETSTNYAGHPTPKCNQRAYEQLQKYIEASHLLGF